jgi:hypothetical protein
MLWQLIPAIIVLVVGGIIKFSGFFDISKEGFDSVAAPSPGPTIPDPREYRPENWCLLSENTVGRFCIKMKKPEQCDPKNLFVSRDACEMTDASALPLGISNTQGRFHSTFMEPRRNFATTY